MTAQTVKEGVARYANWIQFALLLFYLFGLMMHAESRISRLEQRLEDADRGRTELMQRLARIEDKLDGWKRK